MGVLAAILANAGRIALDVAGIERGLVERRREQQRQPVAAAHEVAVERPPSPAPRAPDRRRPEMHAQDCAMESMRHSLARCRAERRAVVEVAAAIPVAVPAVALERVAAARRRAPATRRRARGSPRASAIGANAVSAACRNQPSQTLSPLPASPTRFMPSFQSPVPISGRPCAPVARLRSRPRAQCSNSDAVSSAMAGLEVEHRARRAAAPGLRGTARARRGSPRRRWSRHSAPRRRRARRGRRRCACARPGPAGGSHQCWTSPSANCRAAARRICSRVSSGPATRQAP